MPHGLRRGGAYALVMAAGLLNSEVAVRAEDKTAFELGKRVFTDEAVPHCSICHILSDAEAAGEVGPDLDVLKPTEERVRTAVTQGFEAMPSYTDSLTNEQIDAVSKYVAQAAGGDL